MSITMTAKIRKVEDWFAGPGAIETQIRHWF